MKITIIVILGMIAVCALSTFPSMDSHLFISAALELAFFIGQILLISGLLKKRSNLIQLYLNTCALGIILWLSLLFSDIYPSLIGISLVGTSGISIFVTLFVTMVIGIVRWRIYGLLSGGPFLICMCCLLLARSQWFIPRLADSINDWQFQRDLSEYTSIVDNIKSGLIPTSSTFQSIDILPREAKPSGVTVIRAASWKQDGLVVAFTRSSDKVRVRKGYFFKGFDDSGEHFGQSILTHKFFKMRHVMGNWYDFQE